MIQIYGHFGGGFCPQKTGWFYIFHEGLEETSLCRVKLRGVQESPGPQILRLELNKTSELKDSEVATDSIFFFTVLAPEIGFCSSSRTATATTTKSVDAGPFFSLLLDHSHIVCVNDSTFFFFELKNLRNLFGCQEKKTKNSNPVYVLS